MSLLQELGLEQMPDWIMGPRAAASLTNIRHAFIRRAIQRGELLTIEPLPGFKRIRLVDLISWYEATSSGKGSAALKASAPVRPSKSAGANVGLCTATIIHRRVKINRRVRAGQG